jgi:hypothetical protein
MPTVTGTDSACESGNSESSTSRPGEIKLGTGPGPRLGGGWLH